MILTLLGTVTGFLVGRYCFLFPREKDKLREEVQREFHEARRIAAKYATRTVEVPESWKINADIPQCPEPMPVIITGCGEEIIVTPKKKRTKVTKTITSE